MDENGKDYHSLIGEECHIISSKINGPRHDTNYSTEQLDTYENLILLCRNHHKQIDDQCESFSIDILRNLKKNHEKWVKDKLAERNENKPFSIKRSDSKKNQILHRILTADELFGIIIGAYHYAFGNDELFDDEEIGFVEGFFQEITDYADLMGMDISPIEVLRYKKHFSDYIRKLEDRGFWLFGNREIATTDGGNSPSFDWPIAVLRICRDSNKEIFKVDI